MTAGMAVGRANAFLDSEYGTVYVKLHVGEPGAAGASNAAAGDTTRKQMTMAAATGGSKSSSAASAAWTNGGTSESITHVSLWTAATAGTFLRSGALSTPKDWDAGDTLKLLTLAISQGPLAS